MPKRGFTVITVSDHLKARLQTEASALDVSMPTLIEGLLDRFLISKELGALKSERPVTLLIDCPRYGSVLDSFCSENVVTSQHATSF